MRPGCDRAAVARVAFDPVALQLWLDPLSRESAPVQELCEFHIERLTIPRGWTATDRRPPAAVSPAPVVAVESVEVVAVESVPDVAAGVDAVEAVPIEDQSVEDQSVEDQSVEDQSVEDGSVEDQSVEDQSVEDQSVEGPAADAPSPGPSEPPAPRRRNQRRDSPSLLSRAFAQAGPQESVLTAGSPEASSAESTRD